MESFLNLVVTSPPKQPSVNSCANSEPSICTTKSLLHLSPSFPTSLSAVLVGGWGGERIVKKMSLLTLTYVVGHEGL